MDVSKVVKPAKLQLGPPKTKATSQVKELEHDYAMDVAMLNKRDRDSSTPTTPIKSKTEKRAKSAEEECTSQVSNNAILEAIMGLEKRVETQLEDIKEQTRQSSAMIASLTKAVQYNAEEMKDCKVRISKLENANKQLLKDNDELKEKMKDQERYKMRWSLRVKGIKEMKDENIREKILQVLKKIVPEMESKMEDAVDVVHRLGKKETNRTRNVIILFAQRRIKEEIWKRSKGSAVCKEEGISFAEMLPKEDLEERRRLWPLIEEARKAGKQAFFRGPHAYIEGRRVELNR